MKFNKQGHTLRKFTTVYYRIYSGSLENARHPYIAIIVSVVSQRTVLGPILFKLFIDETKLCVNDSQVRFSTDDTRLSLANTLVDYVYCQPCAS